MGTTTGTAVDTMVPGGRVVAGATVGDDAALVLQTVLVFLIPSKLPDSWEMSENGKRAEGDFFHEVLLEEEGTRLR